MKQQSGKRRGKVNRSKKTVYRQSAKDTWTNMGIKARVALVGSLLAFLALAGQASGVLTGTYHWIRPYADRATEIVTAGWQYDRALSELRDINEQIRRLENKKKVLAVHTRQFPRGRRLHEDDSYFLNRLYRDRKKMEQMLKYIDQTQRPYAK